MAAATRDEARSLLRRTLLELEARGAERLRELVDRPEEQQVVGPSGTTYRVASSAFWDTYPGDSDLFVEVAVSPSGSLLRRSRKASLLVGPYDDEIIGGRNSPQ